MIVIGVDQSITACGIAVIRGTEVLHSSCTLTLPDETLSKAEDDGRRVDAITRDFVTAYRLAQHEGRAVLYKPSEDIVVAIEAPAGSQSAVSAKCMGLAYGAIRGACYALGVAPVVVTARDAKKALTGDPRSTKERVQGVACHVFGNWRQWPADLTDKKQRTAREREAIADALAIARCVQLKGGA